MTDRNGSVEIIGAMMDRLPPVGSAWPMDERVLWLQALESVLHMIYGPVERIDISALVVETASSEKLDQIAALIAVPGSAEPTDEARARDAVAASGSRDDAAETTEAPAKPGVGSERSSSAETYVPPAPKNAGGAPSKSNRPVDMPANLAAAVEAIKALGNRAAAPQIREWIKSKYWPEIPTHWTSVLWGFVSEGKLARDGINFTLPREDVLPKPMPPVAGTPINPAKHGFPPKREITAPAVRKPTVPAKSAAPAARLQAFTFKHGDKSAILSTTKQLLIANRLMQAKGQHIAEAFLAEKVFGSNTERFREQVKGLALGLNGPLFDVGLKVTHYPGFGLMMREVEA